MKTILLTSFIVILGVASAGSAPASTESLVRDQPSGAACALTSAMTTEDPTATLGQLECWEDCLSFSPRTAQVQNINGGWYIVNANSLMYYFGSAEAEARKSLQIIQAYSMAQQCFVGRPGPSMEYLLTFPLLAPTGNLVANEDCIPFNNDTVTVQYFPAPLNTWKIVNGNMWMLDFGLKSDEAQKTFMLIKKYGFNQQCFVGRPDPSFSYWKKN